MLAKAQKQCNKLRNELLRFNRNPRLDKIRNDILKMTEERLETKEIM